MDAFELNDFIQAQIKTGQEFKAPVIRKIKPVSVSPKFNLDTLPDQANQSQNSSTSIKWILLTGAILVGIYLIYKIPKSENYKNYFERRLTR